MRRKLLFYVACYIIGLLLMYYIDLWALVILLTVTAILIVVKVKKGNFYIEKSYKFALLNILLGCFFMCISLVCFQGDNVKLIYNNENNYKMTVEHIEKKLEGYNITGRLTGVNNHEFNSDFKTILTTDKEIDKPWIYLGRTINFSGKLGEPSTARNPRCFNYRIFLRTQGITSTIFVKNFSCKDISSSRSFWYILKSFAEQKKYEFLSQLPEKNNIRSLVGGILFGQVKCIDENIYNDFKENGTAHVLAVSGLHVGIVYNLYKKLVGKKRDLLSNISVISFILFYAFLANFSISVVRAAAMIIINIVSLVLDRPYDILSSMVAVALGNLIINPMVIFSPSFQMSFLAIISISFIGPFLCRLLNSDRDFISLIAVQLGMVPYMIFQFNSFSILSIFVNIPIVYLIGLVVPCGVFSMALTFFNINCDVLNYVISALTDIVLKLNEFLNFNSFFILDLISVKISLLIFLYICFLFVSSEYFLILYIRKNKKTIYRFLSGFLVCSIFTSMILYVPFDNAKIVFLDVGQGDAVHIKFATKDVLLDGGGNKNYNLGEKVLKPYFLKNGVRKLDLGAATHLHMDHYLGMKQLNEIYPIEKILLDGEKGDCINFKNGKIEVIWPLDKEVKSGELAESGGEDNDNMTVFKVNVEGVTVLVTGDLTDEGEEDMLKYYGKNNSIFKADILKIGHHGSSHSTTDEFLEAVSPKVSIIQVGKNNYGHPSKSVVEKLEKKGIINYRTDQCGAVGIIIKKGRFKVCTKMKKNTASRRFPRILRQEI